jgi:opacity protein-like surface antigen
MRYRLILCCALIFVVLFALAPPAVGQARPDTESSSFRAGLSFGYLSRTLDLNEEVQDVIPKMTALLASLVLEYEFRPGFSLSAHVGYSSSTFDGLAFRRLPYSLEIDTDSGSIGGILLGAEVEKSVLGGAAFGVDIRGQFFASLGLNKEWKIPGLAVEGSAKGKPIWMKASVGPVLTYRGWEGVTPFLYPRFDYLWGNFELGQTVQDLKGSEKKDIKGKSPFALGLGADFEFSSSLRLRAEAGLHPRPNGIDYSFMVQTLLAL